MKKVITYFILINFITVGLVYAQDEMKLIKNLESGDWNTRLSAALTIQHKQIKAKEFIEPLLAALRKECLIMTKSKDISHLLKQAYRETLVFLLEEDKKTKMNSLHERIRLHEQIRDDNSSFRNEIIILLGRLGDKTVFDSLMDILVNSKDGYIRSDAALALGSVGDKRAISVLEKISLTDDFIIESQSGSECIIRMPLVRESAKAALKQLGASPDKWQTRSMTNERTDDP